MNMLNKRISKVACPECGRPRPQHLSYARNLAKMTTISVLSKLAAGEVARTPEK
jgi:hypothetical protein